MAITTMAGIQSGLVPLQSSNKTASLSTTAGGANTKGVTDWYTAGTPAQATANAAGVNGQALTAPVTGAMPHFNPGSGNSYLAGMRFRQMQFGPSSIWLIDRLWENSGLDVTLNTTQSITPAAIPSRDINGSTNGDGVMAAVEWSVISGAGTPTLTLSYTNQAGTAGQAATTTAVSAVPAGGWEVFNLAAGDTGIRSIQSFTQSATRTSGTMHLVLFRLIAMIEGDPNAPSQHDALSLGMPRIYDGTVFQRVYMTSASTSHQYLSAIQETIG